LVSFSQKWKIDILQTLYRSIFNHCDVIGLLSYRIWWNNAKRANAIQGHSRSPMSVPIESSYTTSY